MNKILVIIPAFNEEKNITQVIQKIKNYLRSGDIAVINDSSTDQTATLAEKQGVQVISHPFNMGYGAALQTGYKYALQNNYEFIAQLDADGQHEPACLPALLSAVQAKKADVALGSRYLDKKHIYQSPIARKLGTLFFSHLFSVLTGQKITDPTSGFQALNRRAAEFLASEVYPNDFPDADVLLMLHFKGLKVKEVPVKMYPKKGKSMHSGLKPIYYVFKMSLSIFLTLLRERRTKGAK